MSKTITSAEYNAWLEHPLTKGLKRSFQQSITDPENQPSQYGTVTLEMYEALEDQLAAAQEEIKTVTEQKNRMWFEMQSAQNQLVTAEQRVAESCAKWIDGYAGIHQKEMLSDTAKSFADALRRGEWRKFVKEM